MQKHHHTSKAVALASLLLGAATSSLLANPPVNVSAGAGAGAAGSIGVGGLGGFPSAGAGVGGSAGIGAGGGFSSPGAAGAHGAAAGQGSVGVNGIPDANMHGGAFETIGMRQERLAVQAENAGGNALNAPGLSIANEHAVTSVLNAGPTAQEVRTTSADARKQLTADIEAKMDASADALADLKAQSKSFRGEAQAEFKAAMKEADAREKALKKSLKAARKASAETWTEARSNVAADYEAYAQAAQRVETLAAAGSSMGNSNATAGTATETAGAATASANGANNEKPQP